MPQRRSALTSKFSRDPTASASTCPRMPALHPRMADPQCLPGPLAPGAAGVHAEERPRLVGTAVGVLHPDKLILGRDIRPGDSIVGIRSTGIHSNGMTLARKVLLETGGYQLTEHFELFGRTLGEELLDVRLQLTRLRIDDLKLLLDSQRERRLRHEGRI